MAVKVGDSWVSEMALAYAKEKTSTSTSSTLEELSKQYPDVNFSTNIAPFSQSGVKNIQIAPNILSEMQNDPEKRLEYEALIYDCATGIDMLNNSGGGFYTKAAEFIINSDGSLGAWGISVSDDGGQTRSKVSLDKNKKETWAEKIRKKQMEKRASEKKQAQKKQKERMLKKIYGEKTDITEGVEDSNDTAKDKAEKMLLEKIENEGDGEMHLNDEDMQLMIVAAKEKESEQPVKKPADTKTAGTYIDMKI